MNQGKTKASKQPVIARRPPEADNVAISRASMADIEEKLKHKNTHLLADTKYSI